MSGRAEEVVAPSQFPPPVDPREEFVKRTLDDEDERIDVGVAIVGGGPAGLACAIRLMQLLEDEPELIERLGEVPVAVIEKGKVCGAHNLSGAMMRPSALQALLPDSSRPTGRRTGRSTGTPCTGCSAHGGRCRSSRRRRRSATTATTS